MDDAKRLELITVAVRYCQRVKGMGMPPSCYSKALREPIYFLWDAKDGPKARASTFRSKAALGLSHGKGELVHDHAIPFRYLQEELLDLDPATPKAVGEILRRYGTRALITRAENALLNSSGLGHKMPLDWDGIHPLARYEAVGIELLENSSRCLFRMMKLPPNVGAFAHTAHNSPQHLTAARSARPLRVSGKSRCDG